MANENGRDAPKSVACQIGNRIPFKDVPATSRIVFTMEPSDQWKAEQHYTKLTTYADQASLVHGTTGSWELTSMIRPAQLDDSVAIFEVLEKPIGSR